MCAGDTVNITCTGCSSSILLAQTIEEYNSCMSPCTQPQDHIGNNFITIIILNSRMVYRYAMKLAYCNLLMYVPCSNGL